MYDKIERRHKNTDIYIVNMEKLTTTNLTTALVNATVAAPEEKKFLSFIVLNVVCIVGILGNLSALFILLHKDKVSVDCVYICVLYIYVR